ncbi:MAG TPA: acetoacetate--CoA ligase [Acidimicrobiales bacterium]|nr:acetoacetate--CoA ligase [Acidimicrobiales bacterium]
MPGAGGRGEILWTPPADVRDRSRIGAWLAWLEAEEGRAFDSYQSLWRWSVDDLDGFWSSLWRWFDVGRGAPPAAAVVEGRMPEATWFPGTALNYARHALASARADDDPAVLGRSQTRPPEDLSMGALRDRVARCRRGLAALGVGRGDRVAAYLPNISEALVTFLATASLGAVYSSCAPEFGTRSVVDRFGQIGPTVLVAVDGYRYGARTVDKSADLAAIRAQLPSLRATVVVDYLGGSAGAGAAEGTVGWDSLLAEAGPLEFDDVPFDHPLYVLYTSGTTGLPKPIVHGHGGILLEHLKALALHCDLGPGDRFLWFTTTGWMMWNFLVSGLLVDCALVLFDGDPGHPDLGELWRVAGGTGTTFFGTSAPFLLACRKAGIEPGATAAVGAIRTVGSTGAPLPADGFRWVYDHVHRDLLLASISGGTDVCSAFVGAVPLLPVRAGEIPCRYLGARVEAFDEQGRPVIGREGELVITAPLPSMPVGLWGDDDGSRYRASYFDTYPGVWRHGDWITVAEDGSCVISGRSDATLNRGGVRVGTSELYAVVEAIPEVRDSLAVHLDTAAGEPGQLVLFVVVEGGEVDDDLVARIRAEIRSQLSPRHVPDRVLAVPAVPRTLSGKKLEVPVKRILAGTPPEVAASAGALANPGSLAAFEALAPTLRDEA